MCMLPSLFDQKRMASVNMLAEKLQNTNRKHDKVSAVLHCYLCWHKVGTAALKMPLQDR